MKIQFAIFIIIIAFGLWLMFYKWFIKFGTMVNKHFKNIKDEMERNK